MVPGLSLKNLKPRVWDVRSPYYVPGVQAVMISFAELHSQIAVRNQMTAVGVHEYLGVPKGTKVYLDNGAFYFLTRRGQMPRKLYEDFVAKACPDWYPIPREFIPHPKMKAALQMDCYSKTMAINRAYHRDGFVPVMHVGRMLPSYMKSMSQNETLKKKKQLALGAMVPHLLRGPKAMPYKDVITALATVRKKFSDKNLHVFGLGGTATIHIAALLGFDSLDSSGWRNRAARGIVQLPGSGDRMVANLGAWRGRTPSKIEWETLRRCQCSACRLDGLNGLKASGIEGFMHRASHNLWILLREADWVAARLASKSYARSYKRRIDNSIYSTIVDAIVSSKSLSEDSNNDTASGTSRILSGNAIAA